MEIKHLVIDSLPVLRLAGRFDSYGAALFDQQCALLPDDLPAVGVDFSAVSFLSSIGIRSLMKLEKLLLKRAGGVVLVALPAPVAQVLNSAGLLDKMRTAASVEQAVQMAARFGHMSGVGAPYTIAGRSYQLTRLPELPAFLELWGGADPSPGGQLRAQDLVAVDPAELQLAFGVGGFGTDRGQAFHALGEFVSVGKVAGVVPADGHCLADFVLAQEGSSQPIYTAGAIGIAGSPAFFLRQADDSAVTIAELLADLFRMLGGVREGDTQMVGLVVLADTVELVSLHFQNPQDLAAGRLQQEKAVQAGGLVLVAAAGSGPAPPAHADSAVRSWWDRMKPYQVGTDLCFHGHGVLVERPDPVDVDCHGVEVSLARLLDLQNLRQVAHIGADTRLTNICAWVYRPTAVRFGPEKLLKVEAATVAEFPAEWEMIVRRIYGNAGRVVLAPIHGGYMSKTFHVESYDRDGRKMLPTVLKIGSTALTSREEDAHRRYVRKYILNNAATIMGTASCGDWAGLRYNFVGINGPDSRLTWLAGHYRARPAEELIPIFDRIFTRVLKPWYGQPRWETLCPYAEHDPTGLFPHIIEDAERHTGIGADTETFRCRELGAVLPNPYYYLRHEYPQRKGQCLPWYRSMTHGDLNMQNILLDEKDNIYVIDFSETRERNIVADFARMECILRFETVRLEGENDLRLLFEFMEGLTEPTTLGQVPPFRYRGSDPAVEKAYRLICRLRAYADKVTLFEDDIAPYLIALLEWTYPVVSYGSVGPWVKKLSACSAALACGKLLELER